VADEDLIDEYRLVNLIASGSSTQVWEVAEAKGPNRFAMKLMLPESFADKEQVKVLKHEAKVATSLEHPHLVKCYKVVATKEHAYIIMDYFRAPNVKAQINSQIADVQVRIRKLVEGVCQALAYMHEKGWVHRDIKPDNILLSKGSEVRVIDFSLTGRAVGGLGKMVAGRSKIIQGTRTYIAPETIRREPPTPKADIYSFGVTLYELLTGVPPFRGGSPDELLHKHLKVVPHPPSFVNRNVSKDVDEFVLKLLAKKPSERPADMNEIAAQFRSLKVFEEDPGELAAQRLKAEEDRKRKELDKPESILDSRADAQRTAMGVKAPPKPQKKTPTAPPKEPAPKKAAQPAAAPQQPLPMQPQQPFAAPGVYPPGAYPQYAPGAFPGMPYGAPQYAPPQPAQFPGQPAYYPQQPAPMYPPAPQAAPPAAPQHAPGSPPAQPPAKPAAPVAQPAPVQPAARPAAPPQSRPHAPPPPPPRPATNDEDLPTMDELPPIL
jgi:serine/threonine-protein kinase